MASFEIRVINDRQDGLSGVRVKIAFKSLTRGISLEENTDSVGSAYFNGYDDGMIDVYVDGKDCGSFYYKDGDSITITK